MRFREIYLWVIISDGEARWEFSGIRYTKIMRSYSVSRIWSVLAAICPSPLLLVSVMADSLQGPPDPYLPPVTPLWWATPSDVAPFRPVVDPAMGDSENKALVNLGQAKFMVDRALKGLMPKVPPHVTIAILSKLTIPQPHPDNPALMLPPVLSLAVPNPKPAGWGDLQRASLNIGQLKAIAAPFYEELYRYAPQFMDKDHHLAGFRGQLQRNKTKDPSDVFNIYPWSSSVSDDSNRSPVTIGQLKAVFALDFNCDLLEYVDDTDQDGIADYWETPARGLDPNDPTDASMDYDGDGFDNFEEFHWYTDVYSADSDFDGMSDRDEVAVRRNPVLADPSWEMIAMGESIRNKVSSMITGKVGGPGTLNVFSTKNHSTSSYVRNPNLWCAEMVEKLTGCAAYKPMSDGTYEDFGGVMISSRHILFCRHVHPQWNGATSAGHPQQIRFVKSDGTAVDRVLVAGADSTYADLDLCVGLLDSDVPSGIHIAKILPLSETQRKIFIRMNLPDIAVSQGPGGAVTPPVFHDSQAYIGATSGMPPVGLFADWWHSIYPGDSGTPRFMAIDDDLLLTSISGAAPVSTNIARINAIIAQCDASAVTAGILSVPTGKTLTISTVHIPSY